MLRERIERLSRMATAVQYAMEVHQMDMALTPEERFEVFGDHDPREHAAEVEERWGATEPFRESQGRTRSYTKEDWKRIRDEGDTAVRALVAAKQRGLPPDSGAASDAAEAHRQHISRWFYDCTFEIHRGLGQMCADDDRFSAAYERYESGLAEYLRDAILANAAIRDRPD